METEKPRQETEESLILAQLSVAQKVQATFHNGSLSPNASPQHVNGDAGWSGFRSVKRRHSNPPAMFDQMNGETQHHPNEQSLAAKKFCANSEAGSWETKETNSDGCLSDSMNCNGDVYSISRNKQVPIQNGATVTPPSVDSPSGDLVEEPLTQSYPQQAATTFQKSDTSNLQALPSPSLTSGFPNSAEPTAMMPSEGHSKNGYDRALIMNGYLVNFKAEQRQQLPYAHANLPALVNHLQRDSGKVPRSNSDRSLAQNNSECFASNPEGLHVFSNSSHKFNTESYPLPVMAKGSETSSFSTSATDQSNSTVTNQQHLQYRMQLHQSDVSSSADRVPTPPATIKQSGLDQGGDKAPSHNFSWNNLNSPQHSGSQPNMWSHPDNKKKQGQSDSSQRFHTQQNCLPQVQNGYRISTPPTQSHPHVSPETGMPKTPTDMPNLPANVQPQQQMVQQFCQPEQQEQLCNNDQNIDQVLPPDFLCQQPSQPLQQYGIHQQNVRSMQCLKRDSYEGQLPNQQKTEDYMQQALQSPTYKSPKPSGPAQMVSNQSVQANQTFPDQSRPNSQPNEMAFMFGYSDAAEKQKQQRQYSPTTNAQQFSQQQALKHMSPNNLNFQTSPQAQKQLPDDAHNQPMPAKMFPKAESYESCSQFQSGPIPSPSTQADFQSRAALRMHFLQKQERPSHAQSPNNIRPNFKQENGLIRMRVPQMHQIRDLESGMLKTVKQEHPSSAYEQSQQKSILAALEQQLQQYQPSSAVERKTLVIKSPNNVKLEMSGAVAVVSTNLEGKSGDQSKSSNCTPKKEPGLQWFLDSPMKLLDTPIKNLLDTPLKTQYEIPPCHCVEQISEKDEGPYYTHLGAAPNIKGIREMMEKRSGLTGGAIRIEKVVYTGKEGKSSQGCPIAKWVIRRASVDEKLLVLVRERTGHSCQQSCMVVVIVIWEGIQQSLADRLYTELSDTLTKHGTLTNRRCALNEERTCACQGLDPDACGASFSFGCSWSMYYNGCKFARSKVPRKFKLLGDDPKEEEKLERNFQDLATLMAPIYKKMAPEAYSNQVEYEHRAPDCRLGLKEGRPFSGVTACLDFCAHAHRDLHNMAGGSTVVCTLTRQDNREIGKIAEDEQLHVLPLYKAAATDEFGSAEGQLEKTRTGAIQVLSTFRRQVRMLSEPAKSCRQRKLEGKKGGANKSSHLNTPNSKAEAKPKQSSYEGPGQNLTTTGADLGHMATPLGSGQHPQDVPHQPQQQHLQQHPSTTLAFSGPTAHVNYSIFPNTSRSFSSTSKPANLFPQPPRSASPYHSPLPVPNSYINGSNPISPYPGALTPNNIYSGYQCNGAIPMDNFHTYYPNSKHLDIYRHQRPALFPDQQFSPHQQYGLNYPARYGEPGLPINGYGNTIRSSMHPMEQYPGYTPSGRPNTQILDAISRPPSAHLSLDYIDPSKCSQMGRYPNTHQPQHIDPLSMQITPDVNLFPQVLPPFGREVINSCQPPGMCAPIRNNLMKQEPGLVTPAPVPEQEDVWSDSEHNFLDPEIGGVAVAPSHGSILIECAKRELHATTPLKKPDRTHPTRISLVFYQHKNLNEAKHGLALWEAKMAEKAREKEEDSEKHGTDGTPVKSNKRVKKEPASEPSVTSEPTYKRFIQMLAENSQSCTTNTYSSTAPYAFTKVTGPYSHFV